MHYLIYVRYDHLGLKALFSTNTKATVEQINWLLESAKEKIKVNQPLNKNFLGYSRVNRDLIETYMKVQEAMYDAKKYGDLSVHRVKAIYNELHNKSEVRTLIEGIDKIIDLYSNELSESSIQNYDNNLRRHIEGFCKFKVKEYKLLDLNSVFELEFKSYLTNVAKLSESSIDNQIKYLKSLCTKLGDIGVEYNKKVDSFKRKSKETSIVFLTPNEVDRLVSQVSKSDYLNTQKDVFIFQCFTGFRVGDLRRFSSNWIVDERIIAKSEKTNSRITIPILKEAKLILEKYDYQLPVTSDQKYNKAIHDFLEEFKFNRIIEEKDSKPLHEAATSHTARKTFISYAHSRLRLSVADISLISGTSKETIMKYYVGSSIDDIEQKISKLDNILL